MMADCGTEVCALFHIGRLDLAPARVLHSKRENALCSLTPHALCTRALQSMHFCGVLLWESNLLTSHHLFKDLQLWTSCSSGLRHITACNGTMQLPVRQQGALPTSTTDRAAQSPRG